MGALARALALCALGASAYGQENAADALAQRYQALLATPTRMVSVGLPVWVSSRDDGNKVEGDVYAQLEQPFDNLMARLGVAAEWCQVALLHLNVKTCTSERAAGRDWLTFYSGRKEFQPPEKAFPLRFAYQKVDVSAGHLEISLDADNGPFGTHDYRIRLGAIPLARGSFVHVSYSFRSSTLSRMATSAYLATLGRSKSGFTRVDAGRDAAPEYVGGMRGIVERNAVRYYFAVQAYLESANLPQGKRFEAATERWFELTERFALQLHELDRQEYLSAKRMEWDEQMRHQRALEAPGAGVRP